MSAIGRLGRYIEVLDRLPADRTTVSSQQLARLTDATPSTVRQDFHNFLSEKGKSRVGYEVKTLRKTLVRIMGLDKENPIVVIGSGRLCRALVNYKEFDKINIHFPAFFDTVANRVSRTADGIPVFHISELKGFLVKNPDIRIALLALPAKEAQKAASQAVKCGIEAIWNFSPILLDFKDNVIVFNEYIGENLYRLIHEMKQRPQKGGKKMELLVCVGNSCHIQGSEEVVRLFKSLIATEKIENKINLKGSFCMGKCSDTGITIQMDEETFKTTPTEAENFFRNTLLPKVQN
ncbi:MAG: redox-sensing transcriptional repressor Rex [bacterium]|nr:redox-sensing transcriptional repressor Rex [bacterium]